MNNDATRRQEFLAFFEKSYGGDRQKFAAATGVSKGRVTQYFDPDEPFGERAAVGLAKRLGVAPDSIFRSLAAAPVSARSGKFIGVPVVGTAQLGDNGHHCELEYPVGHGDGAVRWLTNDRNAYALRCKGESMKPRVRHGEFVVIEPAHACNSGDEVLVKLKDGRVMVKQLAYSRDGLVHFDSVNESFPRISVAEAEIDVIQYVAGIAKSGLWNEQ